MPGISRVVDLTIGQGSHGLKCCPHPIIGVRVSGSPDVQVEGASAARAYTDIAAHNCPHCTINICMQGSPTVLVNGLGVHQVGDMVSEICGNGLSVTGAGSVIANG